MLHTKLTAELKAAQDTARSAVDSAMQYSEDGIAVAKKAAQKGANWVGGIITKGCDLAHKAAGTALSGAVNGLQTARNATLNTTVGTNLANSSSTVPSLSDDELCIAVGNSFDSIAAIGIDTLANEADQIIIVAGGAVKLSVDAALEHSYYSQRCCNGSLTRFTR